MYWWGDSYCWLDDRRRRLGAPDENAKKEEADAQKERRTRFRGNLPVHPRVFSNSQTQKRLEELEDQGVDPKRAIHTIAKEECGENNGYSVPEAWVEQSGLDPEYFRCFYDGQD